MAPKSIIPLPSPNNQGWGDLYADNGGDSSQAPNHTPNLNKMASGGTLFTDFHVANPVCSPSRTGFMTGNDPARYRIHTALNNNWAANAKDGQANFLAPSTLTVTKILQGNGWRTGHFGKVRGLPRHPQMHSLT